MRKLLILLFLGMFLISFVSAQDARFIGQQDTDINIVEKCEQGKFPCSSSFFCNITIQNPSQTTIVLNDGMTRNETIYNYTLPSNLASDFGLYETDVFCTNYVGNNGTSNFFFKLTYNGKEITQAQSTIYIGLFIVLLFIFIITLFGINLLPRYNQQDEEGKILSISYLKYFRPVLWFFEWMLFITMMYLSSNLAFAYLNEQLFAKILFVVFQICFGLTPLIVIIWMIWIFVSMFHDKQFQKMLNRGMFPQGRLP